MTKETCVTGEKKMLERIKSLFKATDMTVGVPWKQIVMFTLPMLIGNIAQQLYSTVDSIVQLLCNIANQHWQGKHNNLLPWLTNGHIRCLK